MGYFSDSRRNWAGAFWVATAIPLVLDPSNPIWDESGWWEEQFGAPFAPLGPSGGNDYFTPNFWAGRGSERVGRRGPGTSPKVSPIIRGTCSAQSSKLILPKMLPWTPPLKANYITVSTYSCIRYSISNFWTCFTFFLENRMTFPGFKLWVNSVVYLVQHFVQLHRCRPNIWRLSHTFIDLQLILA